MTLKRKVFVLLLVLFTTMGSVQSFAGRKRKSARDKAPAAAVVAAPVGPDSLYHGHKVYTGPRGGRYYYNSNGNKTYIRR